MPDYVVIFLHLPKCGGTSFHTILSREYHHYPQIWLPGGRDGFEEIQAVPASNRAGVELLRGHAYYGIHEFLSQRAEYFTILRDPVSRVVSYYRHVQNEGQVHQDSKSAWHETGRKGLSLREFLETVPDVELDNGMVRRIAGARVPFGKVSRKDLETAIEHIDKHFLFTGLVERFDESVMIFKERLDWKKTPYYVKAKQSPGETPMDESLRTRIKEMNHLDMELYNEVRRRFEKEIARRGTEFAERVEVFRRKNRRMGVILPTALGIWRGMRRLRPTR